MIQINIKPLSINKCFQGRRFKTKEYDKYIHDVLLLLPKLDVGKAPYEICFEFGLSSKLADLDNNCKAILDILVKKYGFDDRDIYFLQAKKVIVKKGEEYIKFKIHGC